MSQAVGDKRPWNGRGQGHMTNFKILHPLKYLWNGGMAEARVVKFCVIIGYINFIKC